MAMMLLAGGAGTARAEAQAVDLELVLAVDASGSVDDDEYRLQLQGIASALRDPAVLEAIRSGPLGRIAVNLLIWAEPKVPKDQTGWQVIGSADEAAAFAGQVAGFPRWQIGGTGIGDGVAWALRSLDGNGLEALRKVVDVSGDGEETTPRDFVVTMSEARAMAVARGVTINGLAITNEDRNLQAWYRAHVQVGTGSFVMSVGNYQDFALAMRRKLIREIRWQPKLGRLE